MKIGSEGLINFNCSRISLTIFLSISVPQTTLEGKLSNSLKLKRDKIIGIFKKEYHLTTPLLKLCLICTDIAQCVVGWLLVRRNNSHHIIASSCRRQQALVAVGSPIVVYIFCIKATYTCTALSSSRIVNTKRVSLPASIVNN